MASKLLMSYQDAKGGERQLQRKKKPKKSKRSISSGTSWRSNGIVLNGSRNRWKSGDRSSRSES